MRIVLISTDNTIVKNIFILWVYFIYNYIYKKYYIVKLIITYKPKVQILNIYGVFFIKMLNQEIVMIITISHHKFISG